jgi:sporulation protein YlmC with PRC-barrel domain
VAQSSDATSTAGSGQQGVLIDSGSLIGSAVRDAQGKDLGKVSRLMIDPKEGKVQSVVVSMGGTLGMGGNSVAMPWDQVKIAQDQGRLVVTVDQQMLQQAPKAQSGGDKNSPSASPANTGGSGAQQK